jgi:hypothetical protein
MEKTKESKSIPQITFFGRIELAKDGKYYITPSPSIKYMGIPIEVAIGIFKKQILESTKLLNKGDELWPLWAREALVFSIVDYENQWSDEIISTKVTFKSRTMQSSGAVTLITFPK